MDGQLWHNLVYQPSSDAALGENGATGLFIFGSRALATQLYLSLLRRETRYSR